jgi:hypothetical protein
MVVLAHVDSRGFEALMAAAPTSVLDVGNSLSPEQATRLGSAHRVSGLAW